MIHTRKKHISWVVAMGYKYGALRYLKYLTGTLRSQDLHASGRLRWHLIEKEIVRHSYTSSLFFFPRISDIHVFQKSFGWPSIALAYLANKLGKHTIFDMNEYLHTTKGTINPRAALMARTCRQCISPSPFLANSLKELNPNTSLIEEPIEDVFFQVSIPDRPRHTLVYVGFNKGIRDFSLISQELNSLHAQFHLNLLIISESPVTSIPGLSLPIIWKKYSHTTLPHDIQDGDIFLAPRDLTKTFNHGHSFSKIGLPMACGLPIVASPVASYKGSPALLCTTNWKEAISKLICDKAYYSQLSQQGKLYTQTHFGIKSISKKYLALFNSIS